MKPIARNAEGLIELRQRGLQPELTVLISLVGPLRHENVTLQADPSKSYDWRAIGGLDVEVITSTKVPFARMVRTLVDIAAGVPRRMVLTFVEGPRVECGEWRQVTDFKVFDWCPMAIGGPSWDSSVKLAKTLFGQLGKSIPEPYEEAMALVIKAPGEQPCA